MKRLFYFGLALLTAFGCAREITPDNDQVENKDADEVVVHLTATRVSMSGESETDSKTSLREDGKVLWKEGDRLKLVTDDGKTIVTEALKAGGETATFTATVSSADVLKWAVYPSETEIGISEEKLTVKILATQDGTFENASISAGEIQEGGAAILMKNVCGLLRFTVPDKFTTASKVYFGGNGLPMNGTATIDASYLQGEYVNAASVAGQGVRVGVNLKGPGTYYAAVLPNAFSGMTMQLFDSEGLVLSESISVSVIPVKRSVIKEVGTLSDTKFHEKRFVTENGGGKENNDGQSWETAWSFKELQSKLKSTKFTNHLIFVTGGTITPTTNIVDLADDTKFKMFGGYPAIGLSGTDITCRDILKNETVFSALGSGTETRRLFNYHYKESASETLMDGITLANTYQNATSDDYSGTCVIVSVSATVNFVNCTFRNNEKVGNAIIRGGNVTAGAAKVNLTFDRCTFKDNKISGKGILNFKYGCTMNIIDCDFSSGNVVSGDGNPYRVSYQSKGGVINFSGNNKFAPDQVPGPYNN